MSQVEIWYWVDDSGQLMQHFELDGYAAMRHGLCAEDKPVQPDQLRENELRRAVRDLVKTVHYLKGQLR